MSSRIATHRSRSDCSSAAQRDLFPECKARSLGAPKGILRTFLPVRTRPAFRAATLALLSCLCAIRIGASGSVPGNDGRRGDDELRIQEVFTSHLPDTIAETDFRASIHPHLGDLRDEDHIRISTGVRYGATSRLEISAGADFYFSHGAGDISLFEEGGISEVHFGAKLNIGRDILNSWHSSIGFDASIPTGDPPPGLTDGMKHFIPYVTFSRRLDSRPNIRIFWGAGLNLVEPTTFPGVLTTNQLDDDSVNVTAGFVIDRGMWHYTFETRYATTRIIGNTDDDLLELRPGIIWEVPKLRDRTRRSNWMIGIGGKVSIGRDGTSLGASGKLRYNFDLKDLFRRKKPQE